MSTYDELIEQARKWPRDGHGEGRWFNAMADEMERLASQLREKAHALDIAHATISQLRERPHLYAFELFESEEECALRGTPVAVRTVQPACEPTE
jgi:hypothetical protein